MIFKGLETLDREGVEDSLEKRLKPISKGRIIDFPFVLDKVILFIFFIIIHH